MRRQDRNGVWRPDHFCGSIYIIALAFGNGSRRFFIPSEFINSYFECYSNGIKAVIRWPIFCGFPSSNYTVSKPQFFFKRG